MTFMSFIQHPLVLFVLGCIVTVLVYRLQKTRRRISYQTFDTIVIDAGSTKDNRLEVRYAGKVVPQVTRTVLRVWNSGTETINRSDIASTDPLSLTLSDDAHILAIQTLLTTRDPIQVGAIALTKTAIVEFDFLDANDGALIAVLHTGKPNDSAVTGTIKGTTLKQVWSSSTDPIAKSLRRSLGRKKRSKFDTIREYSFYCFIVLAALYPLANLVVGIMPGRFVPFIDPFLLDKGSIFELYPDRINWLRLVVNMVFFAIFGGGTIAMIQSWRNRPPRKLALD